MAIDFCIILHLASLLNYLIYDSFIIDSDIPSIIPCAERDNFTSDNFTFFPIL